MSIFIIAGAFSGIAGASMFIVWARSALKDGVRQADENFILGLALIRAAEVLIITWLLMRATGFRFGYLIAIACFLIGIYHGYRADTAREDEVGEMIFKRIVSLAIGFIALFITAL